MKKVITETDIVNLLKKNNHVLIIEEGDIITPLAKDSIKQNGIRVEKESDNPPNSGENKIITRVALASDHNGFELKKALKDHLEEKGFTANDLGPFSREKVDYVDYAFSAARSVATGENDAAIIIDGSGIPSAIVANKLPGVRAAVCCNEFMAKSSREHNNANVLTLGAFLLGEQIVKSITDTWLQSSFLGGRHSERVNKIKNIEKSLFREK